MNNLKNKTETTLLGSNQPEVLEETLFEILPDIIITLDENLTVLTYNKAAERQFGDFKEANISDVLQVKELINKIQECKETMHSQILRVNLENHETPFLTKINCFFIEGRKTLILTMQDSNTIYHLDNKFANFIENAAHEIRTPVTSLLGMLETLEQEKWQNNETINIFAPIMLSQAQRLKNLATDVINISAIEKNLSTAPSMKVDLLEILEKLKVTLADSLNQNGMKLEINRLANCVINGDENELTLLYHHLIINAIQHNNHGSPILIELGETKNNLHNSILNNAKKILYVKVQDFGNGIDPQHLPRLMETFYRVDKSRSRKLGGAGLGLSIVKQILIRHKGFLDIQSKLNEGSSFITYFGA